MKRILCGVMFPCFIVSLLCAPRAASAEADTENSFKTSYACVDSGGEARWNAAAEIAAAQGRESGFYRLTERGAGRYSGFKHIISWVTTLDFESRGSLVRPVAMDKNVYDSSGALIFRESQRFDFKKNIAIVEQEDLVARRKSKKNFVFIGDVVNQPILGLYVQKFIQQGKTSARVTMVSSEPQLYIFDIRIVCREDIIVNGHKKSAYKLCLDPQLGLLNVIKILIPKAYVWHSAAPDFEWLEYDGLEGSIDSPKVKIYTVDKNL